MLLVGKDKVALGVAVASSIVGYRLAKMFLDRHPAGVPIIPNPPGLAGALLRQIGPLMSSEFGAPQARWAAYVSEHFSAGQAFAFSLGPGNWRVCVYHPEDLDHMLLSHSKNYVKDKSYKALEPVIGRDSLVTLRDEQKYSTQRRMVAPAFNPLTLKVIADTVLAAQLSKYMAQLAKQHAANPTAPVLLDDTFDHVALDTVAEAAFKQLNFEGGSVATEFRNISANSGFSVWVFVTLMFPFLRAKGLVARERAIGRSVTKIRNAGASMAASVRTAMKDHEAQSGTAAQASCLIDHLVLEDDLPTSALLDHIVTFLFAGHETTSKAMLWVAYRLALHQNIQEELFEELVSVATLDSIPSIDSVKDLPLLNQILKETMRLHPPVGVVAREAVEDDVLPFSKVFIAKGQSISMNIELAHHSKLVYGEDAEEFIPERWAKEKGLEDRIGSCGWMPFMIGKRNCIGKDFAWNELLLVIAVLVRRFKLSLPPGTPTPKKTMKASIRPKDDLPFILEARV